LSIGIGGGGEKGKKSFFGMQVKKQTISKKGPGINSGLAEPSETVMSKTTICKMATRV